MTGFNALGQVICANTSFQSTPPSAPTLTATAGNFAGTPQVTLSWTVPSGEISQITSFSIYVGTTPGGEGIFPVTVSGTPFTWTDTPLTSGVTYYYIVKASNTAGLSPASNEASATP